MTSGATGNYLNDHPVGIDAVMGCGGPYDWDCTISAAGKVLMTGANSAQFVENYGFFVSPARITTQPVVICTTCHNQHLMNVVKVKTGATNTGLAGRQLRDHVLPSRSVQPGQRHRRQQPDGAVLPPVPWWRSQRNERQHSQSTTF